MADSTWLEEASVGDGVEITNTLGNSNVPPLPRLSAPASSYYDVRRPRYTARLSATASSEQTDRGCR